jgi:hypothetical protein
MKIKGVAKITSLFKFYFLAIYWLDSIETSTFLSIHHIIRGIRDIAKTKFQTGSFFSTSLIISCGLT